MTVDAGKKDFGKLLQESRLLNARIRAAGHENIFLPQLQRSIEQIDDVSSRLAAKYAGGVDGIRGDLSESKAALFLAGKGYDMSRINQELAKLNSIVPATVEQVSTVSFDADVNSFLQSELDAVVFNAIEGINKLVIKKAEDIMEKRQEEKLQTIQKQSKTPESKAPSSVVGVKTDAYARVINAFNEARLRGNTPSLAKEMQKAIASIDGADPRNEVLLDCWRAVNSILHCSTSSEVKEAKEEDNVFVCAQETSKLASLARGSPQWNGQVISGSRKFLEELFLRFVDRTLAQYPRDAMLGGRPSCMERVKAFCEIKYKRLPPAEMANVELVSGMAIWMVLFHLVRGGLLKEALSMAQTMESFLSRNDSHFVSYLKSWVESSPNQLSGISLGQLKSEFSSMMQFGGRNIDPYKIALFKIIGRCDLMRKSVPDAIQTSEDYLWLQLWLIDDNVAISDEDGNPIASAYSLADLQTLITDFGPKHFDPKQSNPLYYFEILSLVGLFEAAIEHLHGSTTTSNSIDALHFALALCQGGCLKLAATNEPTFSPNGINLSHLLNDYSKQLLTSRSVSTSVNYLLCLSLSQRKDYDVACHTAIRDIILQSGDFASLLAEGNDGGSTSLAQYARLMNLRDEKTFMDVITSAAATRCEQEGRFRECIQLYNLAAKYDKVMSVLCHRLSRSFVAAYNAQDMDELKRTAESILSYYSSQTHISAVISPSIRMTCGSLLTLLTLRRLVEDGRWSEATEVLLKLEMLPLDGDVAAISAASDRVRDLSDYLSALLPELLLMAMTIISQRHRELRTFIGIDAGRAQLSELLRKMARNLMMFVGMLRMRIPQEVYSQLARLEITLN